MKKRIFGTLLMGALFVASMSTFVSCKDYDDDINNLQEQINSLSGQVNQKETAIKALISELDAAYKKADADLATAIQQAEANLKNGYQAADAEIVKGYTEGDVATLAAAKTAIEEAKKVLEATIAANYATLEEKNAAQDKAIAQAQADASAALNALPSKADKADLEAAVTRITNLEAKVSTLESNMATALKDIETLQTAVKAQKAALEAVETLAGQNKEAIAKLREDLTAGLNKAATDLEAAKTALQAAISETNENLANEIATVNTTIETVRTELLAKTTTIDTKYEVITIMISKALRSLVYMPTLYVDGIETIEYNYLKDSLLKRVDVASFDRTEAPTPTKTLARLVDYQLQTAPYNVLYYGPAWPVYYHQNPSVAGTKWENIKGYYAYAAEVLNRTRATAKPVNCASTWGITSPEKYANGDQLFQGGAILTAGLQISDPEKIKNQYINSFDANTDIIVALQAQSKGVNAEDTIITSDYAMLLPEKVWIEGLIWKKGTTTNDFPTYWYKDNTRIKNFWTGDRGYATYPESNGNYANHDENCPWLTANQKVHVYDTPEEALTNPADIELFIDDADGVDIMQYMGVHFVHETVTNAGRNRHVGTWAWNDAELKRFGFRWYLDVVDYSATDRTRPENIIRTLDSRYVHFANPVVENGIEFANATTILPNDVVDIDGKNETFTDTKQVAVSKAAANREPLLRVRLYHFTKADKYADYDNDALDINGNKYAIDLGPKTPVLDGYIRVRISQSELKEVAYPEYQVETFDLCNVLTKETNWTLFNQKVLAEGLGIEREQWNALYAPEYKVAAPVLMQYSKPRNYSALSTGDQGAKYYGFYNESVPSRNMKREQVNGKWYITEGEVGTISLRDNYQGTTNDAFVWDITPAELEFITHDLPLGTEVTIERYAHYTGHFEGNRGAKYDDVFIKFTRTVKRADIGVAKLKNQDDDYYRYEKFLTPFTGNATNYLSGYEAVAWNVTYPNDGGSTVPFTSNLSKAFLVNGTANNPAFDGSNIGTWKYYFSPIEVEITDQQGTTWVLTPRRSTGDADFNEFKCAYGQAECYTVANKHHKFHLWKDNSTDETDVTKARSTGALDNFVEPNEAANNKILEECAINYYNNADGTVSYPTIDGVFANRVLYAVKKADYGKAGAVHYAIVTLDQKTGAITLIRNDQSKLILNAIGYSKTILDKLGIDADKDVYEVGQNPIHAQLRAWIGVIAKFKNCDIAMKMSDVNKKDANQFATWMNGWERPINVYDGGDEAVDAKNNGNYIYLVDILSMYDWRGYGLNSANKMTWDASEINWNNQYSRRGAMFGLNYWLWAYYGIYGFDINLGYNDVLTDLHNGGKNWKKLGDISRELALNGGWINGGVRSAYPAGSTVPVRFDLSAYNAAAQNSALINELGFNTPNQADGFNAQKAKYGYIFYTNNGDNVQEFYLKVPVRVYYDWGWVDTKIEIKVGGSMGNLD